MTIVVGKHYPIHFNIEDDLVTIVAKLTGTVAERGGVKYLVFERTTSSGERKQYQYSMEGFVKMQGRTVEDAFQDGEEITSDALEAI